MADLLKLKISLFHNGERFPVIVSENGIPQFYPNTFLTADLRGNNCQFNTLRSAGNAIQVLRVWELQEGIDVIERMTGGAYIKDVELDRLCNAMWQSYDFLKEQLHIKLLKSKPGTKIRSLAAYRRQQQSSEVKAKACVMSGTAAGRMVYVIRYLKYLGQYAVNKEMDVAKRHTIREDLEKMIGVLAARTPEAFGGHIDSEYQRLGLTYEVEGLLRGAIEPENGSSPWHKKVRYRNSMVIKLLLGLGIRGGELLNLSIDDIDFAQNKVHIRRLPDNPDDPRLYEPNVKTLARTLRMKDSLATAIQAYIIEERRKVTGARKHDFLVLSSVDGTPLSRTSFNNIFAAVRGKVPGIPIDFSAHLCRHTWNDRFSDFCDKKGVDEERERKIRCKIMGWMPGSQMALVYTKRSTQAAVEEYMLGQQEYISDSRLGALLDEFTVEANIK